MSFDDKPSRFQPNPEVAYLFLNEETIFQILGFRTIELDATITISIISNSTAPDYTLF